MNYTKLAAVFIFSVVSVCAMESDIEDESIQKQLTEYTLYDYSVDDQKNKPAHDFYQLWQDEAVQAVYKTIDLSDFDLEKASTILEESAAFPQIRAFIEASGIQTPTIAKTYLRNLMLLKKEIQDAKNNIQSNKSHSGAIKIPFVRGRVYNNYEVNK